MKAWIWVLIRSATQTSTWGLKRSAVNMWSDLSTQTRLNTWAPSSLWHDIKCSDFHMNLPRMEVTLVVGNILELIHFPSSYHLKANCLSNLPVIFKNRGEIHTAGDPLFFNRRDQTLVWILMANHRFSWYFHLLLKCKLKLMQEWWRPRKATSRILLVCRNKNRSQFPTEQTWPAVALGHTSP